MDDMQSKIDEFIQVVLRNLEKNGFPDKAVSFPLEKMFEAASQRGFSFNKVRTILEQQNITTELTDQHVIFRSQLGETPDLDLANMAAMAQNLMQQMSPEQLSQLEQMMKDMGPDGLEAMRQQWEAMPPDEKLRMMQTMQNLKP